MDNKNIEEINLAFYGYKNAFFQLLSILLIFLISSWIIEIKIIMLILSIMITLKLRIGRTHSNSRVICFILTLIILISNKIIGDKIYNANELSIKIIAICLFLLIHYMYNDSKLLIFFVLIYLILNNYHKTMIISTCATFIITEIILNVLLIRFGLNKYITYKKL